MDGRNTSIKKLYRILVLFGGNECMQRICHTMMIYVKQTQNSQFISYWEHELD